MIIAKLNSNLISKVCDIIRNSSAILVDDLFFKPHAVFVFKRSIEIEACLWANCGSEPQSGHTYEIIGPNRYFAIRLLGEEMYVYLRQKIIH